MIAENTAKAVCGRYTELTYYDLIKKEPVEQRTGQEIVDDLTKRMGLEVIRDGTV